MNVASDIERFCISCEHRVLAEWAADCAERVLIFFEESSSDKRPREAIDACRAWLDGKLEMSAARKYAFSAHGAARLIRLPAAKFAARAAGHAAATAHVKTHAIHAADYAIKAILANAPGDAAQQERTWQLKELKRLSTSAAK